MNDTGSATEPSGNRTEDQRHEGQQGADGHDRGGGVCGLGSDALRLIHGLMVLLLHLRDLLLRLIERDATRSCERLGRLSARLVGTGLVTGYQRANGVRRGGVQRFRIVTARTHLVLDRIQRICLGDDRSRGLRHRLPQTAEALVMPLKAPPTMPPTAVDKR